MAVAECEECLATLKATGQSGSRDPFVQRWSDFLCRYPGKLFFPSSRCHTHWSSPLPCSGLVLFCYVGLYEIEDWLSFLDKGHFT